MVDLSDVRVLDLSQLVAGPLAAAQLADLGADVIKIEPPAGDKARAMGAAPVAADQSAVFATLNRNKRSIVLDLDQPLAREALDRLVAGADVLIHNFRPRSAERLGVSAERLSELNPRLVGLRITGFGSSGPHRERPAVDYILQAMTGVMSVNGFPDEPVRVGMTLIDIAAGYVAAQAILAALYHRERSGRGDHAEVSLYDAGLAMQMLLWADYLQTGITPPRTGNSVQLGSPVGLFDTLDGRIVVSAYFPAQWPKFCARLGMPELAVDERFATNQLRLRNRDELHRIIEPVMRSRTSSEWLEMLEADDITCGRLATFPEVERDPQTEANGIIVEIPGVRPEPVRVIGAPVTFGPERPPVRIPSPSLGADTAALLQELGFDEPEIAQLAPGAPKPQPAGGALT